MVFEHGTSIFLGEIRPQPWFAAHIHTLNIHHSPFILARAGVEPLGKHGAVCCSDGHCRHLLAQQHELGDIGRQVSGE